MGKERNYQLDNLKFYMVLLVVIGHLLERSIETSALVNWIYNAIYLIHIPALVTISGMLSSKVNSKGKLFEGLVVPLVGFTLLYEGFHILWTGYVGLYLIALSPFWLLWFLLSLFCWRLALEKLPERFLNLPLCILISILAGYVDQINYVLGISRTIFFFPFFILGYRLANGNLHLNRKPTLPGLQLIAGLSIAGGLLIWNNIDHKWLYGSLGYTALGVEGLAGPLLRILFYTVSMYLIWILLFVAPKNKRFTSIAGERSHYPYLWHGFFVLLTSKLWLIEELTAYSEVALILVAVLVALVLMFVLTSRVVVIMTNTIIFRFTGFILKL